MTESGTCKVEMARYTLVREDDATVMQQYTILLLDCLATTMVRAINNRNTREYQSWYMVTSHSNKILINDIMNQR